MANFVDIRMIVLAPGQDKVNFISFMTKPSGFLDEFGKFFSEGNRGLIKLTFLEGNKKGPSSNEDITKIEIRSKPITVKDLTSYQAKEPKYKAAAGANADFAWIAYWESIEKNDEIWNEIKLKSGDIYVAFTKSPLITKKLWEDFFDTWCHKRVLGDGQNDYIPTRPLHGPPYDYLGGVPTLSYPHYGRGAGCLVEGFNVIYEWPK